MKIPADCIGLTDPLAMGACVEGRETVLDSESDYRLEMLKQELGPPTEPILTSQDVA